MQRKFLWSQPGLPKKTLMVKSRQSFYFTEILNKIYDAASSRYMQGIPSEECFNFLSCSGSDNIVLCSGLPQCRALVESCGKCFILSWNRGFPLFFCQVNPNQIHGILFHFTSFPEFASSFPAWCWKSRDHQPSPTYCVFYPFIVIFRL